MSYDLELGTDLLPPKADIEPARRKSSPSARGTDLEAIVMLLELAAISLTSSPGDVFSADQLFNTARELGGDELVLDRKDVEIVLDKASFLKKQKKHTYQLK